MMLKPLFEKRSCPYRLVEGCCQSRTKRHKPYRKGTHFLASVWLCVAIFLCLGKKCV